MNEPPKILPPEQRCHECGKVARVLLKVRVDERTTIHQTPEDQWWCVDCIDSDGWF